MPFADATSGSETYGAGRYLLDTVKGADLGEQDGLLVLDFNFAYQPSCSYDPRWACPLGAAGEPAGGARARRRALGAGLSGPPQTGKAADGLEDGILAFDHLEDAPDARGLVEHGHQHRADVGPRDAPAPDVLAGPDAAGGRIVGERARTHDGVLQPALDERSVGLGLGLQIRRHAVFTRRGRVRPHRGDHHVAGDPVLAGGGDRLERAAEVHRALALGPAPRTGARREDERVGGPDGTRDALVVELLEIAQDRLGPGLAQSPRTRACGSDRGRGRRAPRAGA